jgi:hypothetical protein
MQEAEKGAQKRNQSFRQFREYPMKNYQTRLRRLEKTAAQIIPAEDMMSLEERWQFYENYINQLLSKRAGISSDRTFRYRLETLSEIDRMMMDNILKVASLQFPEIFSVTRE